MNELFPFGFAATGKVLDGLTTSFYCNRYGAENELSNPHRKFMEDRGVWKSFPKRQLVAQGILLGTGIVLYGIDHFFGVENEIVNLHKGWLYGLGGVTYIAAINNSFHYTVEWIKEKRKRRGYSLCHPNLK